MNNLNQVALHGRLTRDSELKKTNSGFSILKFAIANNYSKKNGDKYEDEANFFDCVLLGKRAEKLAQYLQKGKQVILGGELRQERWSDADGTKRSKVVIIVNHIEMLGGNSEQSSNTGQFDEDIPF